MQNVVDHVTSQGVSSCMWDNNTCPFVFELNVMSDVVFRGVYIMNEL